STGKAVDALNSPEPADEVIGNDPGAATVAERPTSSRSSPAMSASAVNTRAQRARREVEIERVGCAIRDFPQSRVRPELRISTKQFQVPYTTSMFIERPIP